METFKTVNGQTWKLIVVKSVRRKDGTVQYPKKGKAIAFWVPVDKAG